MPLAFGSLFAGIGGIDIGFERAGMRCKWQVEIDSYANRVLEKNWPTVARWDDIKTFPPAYGAWQVDVIAGGFPCQDISYAGKGAGLDGERSGLFYEACRVIRLLGPGYVVLENVSALLDRGMGDVLGTLASLGFDVEWHCLPASSFGAHHRRDRVFIIATSPNAYRVRFKVPGARSAGVWSDEQFTELVLGAERMAVPAGNRSGILDGVSNRAHRLRGLGNAVVPQIAEYIGNALQDANKGKR